MLTIIHFIELLLGFTAVIFGFVYSDRTSRIPYSVYFVFYIITSFIGGLIIFYAQDNILLWETIFFRIDSGVLPSPLPERYFQLLIAPLLIVPTVVVLLRWLFPVARSTDTIAVRIDRDEFGAIALIAVASLLFCVADMVRGGVALTGYLSSAQTFIDYTGKMIARHGAFAKLNIISISIIYTILPMLAAGLVASLSFLSTTPTKRRAVLATVLFLVTVDLYLCTVVYIKAQIIITMIYVILAMSMTKRIRFRHVAVAGIAGIILLGVLYYFLSFAGGPLQGSIAFRLAVMMASYQALFRMAVGLPFYACLFPDVQPYPGVAMGPNLLGLAPKFATNSLVFNYMAPFTDGAVQGHQPAPAHFSAYAGGGMVPALIWLALIGVLIFLIGRFGRSVRTALGVSMFVVWCIYIYYVTQGGLYSSFWASYGPFWGFLLYIVCRLVKAVIGALRQRAQPESKGISFT